MRLLLSLSLFSASLFGQAFYVDDLLVVSTPLVTASNPIAQFVPLVPNAKPGFMVTVQRADGRPLTADAYRITIRYTRDGITFEYSKIALPDQAGAIFYVDGKLVSASATPLLWFEERIQ